MKENKYFSKSHKKSSEEKMKQVAEWQKLPLSQEEKEKIAAEHFEVHGLPNPNKKAK
ncbi:MAG: hypothetical protein JEZ03_17200 [Bacteroidales bacterium]|nr:hypothetical protein [Bacteroidales bacterium]